MSLYSGTDSEITGKEINDDKTDLYRMLYDAGIHRDLERLLLESMPRDRLPLFTNREWLFHSNEDLYRKRLSSEKE